MEVSALFREGIIDDFLVSLGDILGRIEAMEILVVLELEGRNAELENIGDFLHVVPVSSLEITSGTSTSPLW